MTERALITGITGQDGSYLAEFLLDKGYEVVGMVRRSSTMNFERIFHIQDRVTLVPGDLLDEVSLIRILGDHRPTEVYNLAAQSFVQTSFGQPVLTGETTALGVTRILDAIRIVDPSIRFYQASSSEMFGKVVETPQRETTPFHPRSPYGVAKVYGHWITINYRESYDLHASSGLLFNHESVPADTPVVVRRHGFVDIVPIGDIVPHRSSPKSGPRYSHDGGGYEVWDGNDFVRCTARTAYWHDGESVVVHGRGGIVESTPAHVLFTERGEVEAETITDSDSLVLGADPARTFATTTTEEESWLLGILTAEGYIHPDGSGRITCNDDAVLAEAARCWERVTGGYVRKYAGSPSAFGTNRTSVIDLLGNAAYLRMLRGQIYTRDGGKRVPMRILNGSELQHLAFLAAYNLGDGLRAGHGTDVFKAFRTTSAALAAGLIWMVRTSLGRRVTVYRQPGALGGGESYLININSPHGTAKGSHLIKPLSQVRKIERRPFRGWMFDIETETGRFAAGVGSVVVHNSPRRGLEFVTRKISHGAARIKHGLDRELSLGNLDAQRDWGHASDYVRAMWLMLQQGTADDYVISTGATHSVREFCELAFSHVGLDWSEHVVVDEKFIRPAEVDLLVGDSSKAKEKLGWSPEITFPELVRAMVDADMDLVEWQLRAARKQ